jgi:hypothetical protein
VERGDGLLDLKRRPHRATRLPPRLLGAYDPLLLGWTSREPILGPHVDVVTRNGLFRPIALVAGRAVATWRLAGGAVTIEPFEHIPSAAAAALDAEAADVVRFLAGSASATPRARARPGA